jgi:hypothetical protein
MFWIPSLFSRAFEAVNDFAVPVHDQGILGLEQPHIFNRIFPGVGQRFMSGDVADLNVLTIILDAIGHPNAQPYSWHLYRRWLQIPTYKPLRNLKTV